MLNDCQFQVRDSGHLSQVRSNLMQDDSIEPLIFQCFNFGKFRTSLAALLLFPTDSA